MQSQVVDGVGSIMGGEYDRLEISGVGTGKGDITANILTVNGVFKSNGKLNAGEILCGGVGEFTQDIRAKHAVISGVMKLSSGAKFEAEEIFCDGCLSMKSELSADKIKIDGCIKAREIFGEEIDINSHHRSDSKFKGLLKDIGDFFGSISNGFLSSSSEAELIEATNITLRNVRVKQVNGADIIIGENCIIDNVDCTHSLRVHHTAKINNITGVSPKYTE